MCIRDRMEAAPTLPTFSLSYVGLGYWAVAGVVQLHIQVQELGGMLHAVRGDIAEGTLGSIFRCCLLYTSRNNMAYAHI